jgi:hypothetical protein
MKRGVAAAGQSWRGPPAVSAREGTRPLMPSGSPSSGVSFKGIEMIQIVCPNCNVKLRAKQEWAGRRTKCPKCGTRIEIPSADDAPPGQAPEIETSDAETLPVFEVPERFSGKNHYLILSRNKLFAAWQNDGQGWKLRTAHGFASAGRSHDQLPAQGKFVLVELVLEVTDDGLRLTGLTVYQLAERYALTRLERDDDDILKAIVGLGSLNREQKNEVRKYISKHFMPAIWSDSTEVREFLSNTDFHSPGTVFDAAHE